MFNFENRITSKQKNKLFKIIRLTLLYKKKAILKMSSFPLRQGFIEVTEVY